MIDGIFLLALFILLIQNTLPILAFATIAICLARGFAGKITQKGNFRALELAIVVCVGYWIANFFWSTGDLRTLLSASFLRWDGALLITYPMFFFLLGWKLKPKVFRMFWMAFLTMLAALAACGSLILMNLPYFYHLQFLHIAGSAAEFEGARLFYAWYLAHDTAGGVYTMASMMLLCLLVEGKYTGRLKTYIWVLFLCTIGGLAFTYSRSGYLGFMAGSAVVLPIREFRKALKIGLLLAIPIIVVLLSKSTVLDRIDTITDPNWGTNATRFILWRDAYTDFRMSPIVGIGFGRYNDLRRVFAGVPGIAYVAVHGETMDNSSSAHNSYLEFLAEGGIVGLFVTMFVWWCAWKELSYFERALPRSSLHPFHRAGKGALVAMLVYCIFDHVLGSGTNVLLLMSLIGLTIAASRAELAVKSKASSHLPMRVLVIPRSVPVVAGGSGTR